MKIKKRVLPSRENGVNEDMKVRLNKEFLWATEFPWWKQRVVIENKFGLSGGS